MGSHPGVRRLEVVEIPYGWDAELVDDPELSWIERRPWAMGESNHLFDPIADVVGRQRCR